MQSAALLPLNMNYHEHLADNGICNASHFLNSGHTATTLLSGQRSRGGQQSSRGTGCQNPKPLQRQARNVDWVVLSAENFVNMRPDFEARLSGTIVGPIEAFEAIAYVSSPVAMYASSI